MTKVLMGVGIPRPLKTLRDELERDRREAEVRLAAEIQAQLGCLRDDAMRAAKEILDHEQNGGKTNE